MSQRASSRSSGPPNTAVLTSSSIAGEARTDSSWTVTRPSRTVTAFLKGFVNMLGETKREASSGKRSAQSNDPALIGRGERFPLLLCGIRSRPAQKGVRELFAQLDARLVESIDPVQLAGVG